MGFWKKAFNAVANPAGEALGWARGKTESALGLDEDDSWKKLSEVDRKYLEKVTADDKAHISKMEGLLEEWRANPYLKELLGPAFESRNVAKASESVDAGMEAAKRSAAQTSTAQRLGKAHAAQQQFRADMAGAGQKGDIRREHAQRRTTMGAQTEEAYTQGKADIAQQESDLKRGREQMAYQMERGEIAAREQAKKDRLGKLGSIAGAGLGFMAGGPAGAMMGAQMGSQLMGGQPSAYGGPLMMATQAFGGQRGMQPPATGHDPLLAYAFGQQQQQAQMQQGQNPIQPYTPTWRGQPVQTSTSYNQTAISAAGSQAM